jgi:hypothetical protein
MTETEIARMQAVVASSPDVILYPDSPRATVTMATTADDGMGGSITSTVTISTDRRCIVRMLRSTSNQEAAVGDQPISAMPREIDLEPGSAVPLGAIIAVDGDAYEVTALLAPATYVPSVRCIAKKVQ